MSHPETTLSQQLTPARSLNRSEEHTSELQSQSNLVCRLLLEKQKSNKIHGGSRSFPYTPRPRIITVSSLSHRRPRKTTSSRSHWTTQTTSAQLTHASTTPSPD